MIRVLAAWYLAAILWLSGIQHVANPFYFYGTVLDYRVVQDPIATWIAAWLPWIQVLLAGCLLLSFGSRREMFWAATLLGIVFVGAQGIAIWLGAVVDCGSFGGATESPIGVKSLMIAGSVVVAGFAGWIVADSNATGVE